MITTAAIAYRRAAGQSMYVYRLLALFKVMGRDLLALV